ncbi:MAG: class I SAM-dependent methyltransferase, partial [Actinomycetota bacterium]
MDATEFRRASRAVWEAMAPGWDALHAYFEEVARPVTELMLAALAPKPGDTILDLAAGTGIVGFAAARLVGDGGRVIVSDFSEAMVESAKRRRSEFGLDNVECRLLDAERMDLPDDSVDGVVCRWGYMLMADPAAAFAETRRVLRRGGRLSCAVFAGPERNPWVALPMTVLQERGVAPPPHPGAPGILALADRDRLRRLFTENGFADPDIEDVEGSFPVADIAEYWWLLTKVAGALAMILDKLDDDERERIRHEIEARLRPFQTAHGIELPAVSVVASAPARI